MLSFGEFLYERTLAIWFRNILKRTVGPGVPPNAETFLSCPAIIFTIMFSGFARLAACLALCPAWLARLGWRQAQFTSAVTLTGGRRAVSCQLDIHLWGGPDNWGQANIIFPEGGNGVTK